jgi:hypothetical protein
MRPVSLRCCVLLIPALLWLPITGCNMHDRAWDTDADATPSQPPPPPASTAPPAPGEVIVSVGAGGTIVCKVNGASISPLNGDDVLRNEGGAPGSRLLIVQDNVHNREECFAVAVDLYSPDISSEGRTTLRHIRHNLVIETDGPSIVTLFTQEVQDDIDDMVAFAGNNYLYRLANRLNADPALIDGRDRKHGKTALARAAEAGRTEVVDFLLSRKASTEVKDDQGFTPLHLAVLHGRLDIVKHLVQHGADVNAVTAAGNTPMHLALKNGHTEIAAYLAGAGADSNRPNQAGKTPMQIALDKVFELGERRDYGPFADGSSIRYEDSKLYVRRADKTDQQNLDQFDLPASKEKWISLQGTHFMVMVRDHGTSRVWARYHPADSTTTR